MPRDRIRRYGDERITLRQTLVIAVLLHLMLGGALQWRPDLLWSAPVAPPPRPEPIEFRFVDIPEAESPEETPDTDVMSDRDRVAADNSERDDAEDPFSEGNTSQEVIRGDPDPFEPQPQPAPPAPVAPETNAETPDAQPTTEEVVERSPDETATAEELEAAEETAAPPEATTTGVAPLAAAPPVLPPSTPSLRDSLVRGLQSYLEPEVFANSDGGADGQQGLVSFDTKGYDLGEYIAEILRIIEYNWKSNIPPAAGVPGQRGAVFVRLSIVREPTADGETARIVVHRTWSSEKPAFDQAALFALEISNPLPPLPGYFPYQTLDGRLGFLYNLEPSQVTFPVER